MSELGKEANIINVNNKIRAYTDNQSLYDTDKTNLVPDGRLQVEISSICEIQNVNKIEKIRIEIQKQISDVLMKKGATPFTLTKTCQQKKGQPLTITK